MTGCFASYQEVPPLQHFLACRVQPVTADTAPVPTRALAHGLQQFAGVLNGLAIVAYVLVAFPLAFFLVGVGVALMLTKLLGLHTSLSLMIFRPTIRFTAIGVGGVSGKWRGVLAGSRSALPSPSAVGSP